MANPKPKYKIPIAIRITPDQKSNLQLLADNNETSVSAVIRVAIKQYLKAHLG